jgi:hypothetical protein
MKLFAFVAASAYANTPSVKSCNDVNGQVVVSATVPVDSVQEDLSALADWTKSANGKSYEASWNDFSDPAKWTKTQEERTRVNPNDGSTIKYQALVLKTTIDSEGCDKKKVDDVEVCIKTGHKLSFECSYSLENQDLDSDFTVSGSDFVDSQSGVGKLTYTLALTNSALTIGETATATITPKTSGLVHASINECHVAHDNDGDSHTNDETVSIIDAGLYPICPLSASIETGKGTGVLTFSWTSFKWTTQKKDGSDVVEDQTLKCAISLSMTAQGPQKSDWTDMCGKNCDTGMTNLNNAKPFTNIATLDACKVKCESTTGCTAVTFFTTTNDCWVKDKCGQPSSPIGFAATGISAALPEKVVKKKLTSTYCYDKSTGTVRNDFSVGKNSDLETCKTLCKNEATCTGFTYYSRETKCNLFTSCEVEKPSGLGGIVYYM